MRYAPQHAALARALASRPGGVTAKELAAAIKRSVRLANAIIHTIYADEVGFELRRRVTAKGIPGPVTKALVARGT